jgi:hypothetical protein
VGAFTAEAHKLSRSLSAYGTDQPHPKWGNLSNRIEQHECIKLPLASAQAHTLRLSLPQAWPRKLVAKNLHLFLASYLSILCEPEEQHDKKILY